MLSARYLNSRTEQRSRSTVAEFHVKIRRETWGQVLIGTECDLPILKTVIMK